MKRKFWIDTDTASDDAVALIMAFMHPEIDVVGLSIVAGNVPDQRLHTRRKRRPAGICNRR